MKSTIVRCQFEKKNIVDLDTTGLDEFSLDDDYSERTKLSAKNKRFDNLFNKHVKKKKRYEIAKISTILSDCASKSNCYQIVDIGSGMGHLARILAFRCGLKVACIEQNEKLLEGARKWDEQLQESLAKHIEDFADRKPRHVSLEVGSSHTPEERKCLADRLSSIFEEEEEVKANDDDEDDDACSNRHRESDDPIMDIRRRFGLIGLHPCGDLAVTLLRFFAAESRARFICVVGCCYMKLTTKNIDTDELGYPLSQCLRSRIDDNGVRLSYNALETACHALENHCDKLIKNDYNDLKIHAYRAALEYLLVSKNVELKHSQVKSQKIKDNTSFFEYCQIVTEKIIDDEYRPTAEDCNANVINEFLKQWTRVLKFGSLRFLLAPLIESLILYDRFLYLSELNLSPMLKAEFDPRVSPRNILLVSRKSDDL